MSNQKSVGTVGKMPGTEGFTMACFKADKVPVGTELFIKSGQCLHQIQEPAPVLASQPEIVTGPCGQCKDDRQPCCCAIDTMLKERGLVAVDAAHYAKIAARAKGASAVVAVPDERAAFERWVVTKNDWNPNMKRKGEDYDGPFAQTAWIAWQARAALAATPAAAPVVLPEPIPQWLRDMEWCVIEYVRSGYSQAWCPQCGGCKTDYFGGKAGHKDGCEFRALLATATGLPAQDSESGQLIACQQAFALYINHVGDCEGVDFLCERYGFLKKLNAEQSLQFESVLKIDAAIAAAKVEE